VESTSTITRLLLTARLTRVLVQIKLAFLVRQALLRRSPRLEMAVVAALHLFRVADLSRLLRLEHRSRVAMVLGSTLRTSRNTRVGLGGMLVSRLRPMRYGVVLCRRASDVLSPTRVHYLSTAPL
jgi:hypothetical protein